MVQIELLGLSNKCAGLLGLASIKKNFVVSVGVAFYPQTSYAGFRERPMAGETVAELPRSVTSQEKAKKTPKNILEAILQFIKALFRKEEAKKKREAVSQKQLELPPEKVEKAKKILPGLPDNRDVQEQAAEFAQEVEAKAGGKPLHEIRDETLLLKHYLLLRQAALRTGEDTSFLKPLEEALQNKGVAVEDTVSLSEKSLRAARDWKVWEEKVGKELTLQQQAIRDRWIQEGKGPMGFAGGAGDIDVSGITDERLLREIDVWNTELQAFGEDRVETLQEAIRAIGRLDEGVDQTQKLTALGRVQDIIRRLSDEDREERRRMKEEREEQRKKGWYQERKILPEDKTGINQAIDAALAVPETNRAERDRILEPLDQLFNRMFDKADSNPHSNFQDAMDQAGRQEYSYYTMMLNELKGDAVTSGNIDKVDLLDRLIQRYAAEHKLRELLHNAYWIADTGQKFDDFVGFSTQFQAEFADLAFLNAPEVEVALRVREQVLYQIKEENNGDIPYHRIAYNPTERDSEFDRRSKEMLRSLNAKGIFEKTLPQWKLDRALSISRGFGMVTMRLPEIVAECPLSWEADNYGSQRSIPWETITWELNFLDHKIKRYSIAREVRSILYVPPMGEKRPLRKPWTKEEMEETIGIDAVANLAEHMTRGVDMRNLFKIGSPITHTGWRIWTAAAEEDMQGLRGSLRQSPGLGIKLLFNRYEQHDQALARQAFKQAHPDWDEQTLAREWAKKKGEDKTVADSAWRETDIAAFVKTIKRIPHVVFRIITDKNNRLLGDGERRAILREIFPGADLDSKEFKDMFKQTLEDLTLAKEHMFKRRREAMARTPGQPIPEDNDVLTADDFATIRAENDQEGTSQETVNRRERAKKFRDVVLARFQGNKELQKEILTKIADRKFPFALTSEDVPWSEFHFIQTGGRGFITRKMNDNLQDKMAQDETINLLKHLKTYRSPEDIVAQMQKIFDAAEIHDTERAQEAIQFLAKGLIRFFQKDWYLKIPVFGEVMGISNAITHRGNSMAQLVYGGKGMSWDSDDTYNFTEQLRQILTFEQVAALREEVNATFWKALVPRTKLGLYFLLLIFLFEMGKRVVEEK